MARYLGKLAAIVLATGAFAACGGADSTPTTPTTTDYALDSATAAQLADFERRGGAYKPSMMDWFAANLCDETTPAQCRCMMDTLGANGDARGFMLAVEAIIRDGENGRHDMRNLAATCA